MATRERALFLAGTAHLGQVDKAGAPYILHPLRLMLRAQNETAKMVALLHDTVEDTTLTLDMLRQEGFSEPILTALDLLTHPPELSYEAYIERLQDNPLAVQIKLLDLADNQDVRRLNPPLSLADRERLERYQRAEARLRAVITDGSTP